ncbi:hypothetical protein J6V85_03680 [Candidatus Saccharibacteria bacterium]|nr:hypothetical protein [Candidatus Saccharibacteria bacterium]
MAREINLVPDIKEEMIKTLKLRNFIFFLCIIVASASIAAVVIFGGIAGGQQIAIDNKKNVLETFSDKLNSYSDLNEFLTIKDQVGNIATLTSDKKVISRTFNILSALIPQNGLDEVSISELKIDLVGEEGPKFKIEAQVNAGQPPYIDYNVLDSIKKGTKYMRYDYGNYVDKEGVTIPAYCIIERDSDGAHFADPTTKDKYAYWTIMAEGCNNLDEKDLKEYSDDEEEETEKTNNDEEPLEIGGYQLEDYNGTKVVKIWRTPQKSWYKENPRANQPQMTENGEISNVAHFESQCIHYQLTIKKGEVTKIDDTDNTCILIPGETDEERFQILESSNGRDASDVLVLRFEAEIKIEPEVFNFNNSHLIALAPPERRNVTDSYVQIQSLFGQRAKDCQEGDTACGANGGN